MGPSGPAWGPQQRKNAKEMGPPGPPGPALKWNYAKEMEPQREDVKEMGPRGAPGYAKVI